MWYNFCKDLGFSGLGRAIGRTHSSARSYILELGKKYSEEEKEDLLGKVNSKLKRK